MRKPFLKIHLKQTFEKFVESMSDSELIDNLPNSNNKKADYFFFKRKIICEQKSIEKDVAPKIQIFIDKLMERKDAPIVYGKKGFNQLIDNFPNKEILKKQIIEIASTPIEEGFEKGNRQIRDTKIFFNLNDSKGLLLILNESSFVLDTKITVYRLSQLLTKKTI